MKKFSTKNSSFFTAFAFTAFSIGCLWSGASFGQKTFYSRFPDPTGKYQITNATGGCDAPPIQSPSGFADSDPENVSYFSANISEPYTCNIKYTFDAYLNLPVDSPYLQAGNNAGWHIRVPTGTNTMDLGKYLIVSTYLDGQFQEYNTGSALQGVDAGQNGVSWFIYFKASKPFNILELVVDPAIIKLNSNFRFEVVNAFGGAVSTTLPATIANFKAEPAGKNVNISWQSLTETNVSSYRIERSINGGSSYVTVGNIAAKGNSNTALSYKHSDLSLADGNYLYRIVIVNTDGSSSATNSLPVAIAGQGKLIIYPTLVSAGQNVTVKTSETGLVTVRMFDAQGRMVKEQRTTSNGQFSVSTSGLSKGVYNVKITSASGSQLQSKIVVN